MRVPSPSHHDHHDHHQQRHHHDGSYMFNSGVSTRFTLRRSLRINNRSQLKASRVCRAWLHSRASTNREAFLDSSPEKGVKYLMLNRPKSKNSISMQLLKVCILLLLLLVPSSSCLISLNRNSENVWSQFKRTKSMALVTSQCIN